MMYTSYNQQFYFKLCRETLAPVTGNTCKNESNSTVKQKIENNLNVHLEETKEANCG